MANENKTVEQLCESLQDQSLYNDSIEDDAWAIITDMCSKILAAHKRDFAAKDAERLTVAANYESVIEAKDRIIAAKDAEIERLRAAIKPVLEVRLVDEGVRSVLTTPCAVCDWEISGCEEDCEALAVFKAAKECQRIYNKLEVANG